MLPARLVLVQAPDHDDCDTEIRKQYESEPGVCHGLDGLIRQLGSYG